MTVISNPVNWLLQLYDYLLGLLHCKNAGKVECYVTTDIRVWWGIQILIWTLVFWSNGLGGRAVTFVLIDSFFQVIIHWLIMSVHTQLGQWTYSRVYPKRDRLSCSLPYCHCCFRLLSAIFIFWWWYCSSQAHAYCSFIQEFI